MNSLTITQDKITTVADWRNFGVNWKTAIRRHVISFNCPVFVLRADGRGQLFWKESNTMRQRTWNQVSVRL